ncbi:transporter [Pseudomonas aeruginosa]|nr:transporter [Pseudomonas aeruginosa]
MLMMGGMAHIDWDEHTETIPAIVTVIMMPLTFSVADGIALGLHHLRRDEGPHRQAPRSLGQPLCLVRDLRRQVHLPLTRPGWRMAARGYPPRTCRCPAGLATHSLIRRPFTPCAASSCPPPQMADNRQPSAPSPRTKKGPLDGGPGKRTQGVNVSWHAPSCRDRSNSCRARSAAAHGSDRRRRRCRNAAPPGRGMPAPAIARRGRDSSRRR